MLIEDVRAALESVTRLALGADMRYEHNENLDRLRELVSAYDALAPDWSSAPEDAKWAAIHPDGEGDWWGTKPIALDYRMEWDGELAHGTWWRQGPLPIGIDWRLCIWQRPEATR
jgi:hypothetical protein